MATDKAPCKYSSVSKLAQGHQQLSDRGFIRLPPGTTSRLVGALHVGAPAAEHTRAKKVCRRDMQWEHETYGRCLAWISVSCLYSELDWSCCSLHLPSSSEATGGSTGRSVSTSCTAHTAVYDSSGSCDLYTGVPKTVALTAHLVRKELVAL
jgi:hypothetical protein